MSKGDNLPRETKRKGKKLKPSQRHSRNAERLFKFRNAYVQLINASVLRDTFPRKSMGPAIDEIKWQALIDEVSRGAGPAGPIYPLYGPIFQTHSGQWINRGFNPVVGWKTSIDDIEQFPPQTLISSLDGAVARAQSEAEDARDRERGLTGFIARFIRWPLELREAVGKGAVIQGAALTVGLLGQVFVTVTSGLIIYWINTVIWSLIR